MASLTMAQVYAYARQAGFDPAAAVIVAAIAAGESGLRADDIGDESLVDAKWGPSVGLMQIRTLKADTGTGRVRDITGLTDPLQNLVAAYEISGHGRDFSPWKVYTNGTYREFVGQAQGAARSNPVIPGANVIGVVDGSTPGVDFGIRLQGMVLLGVVAILGGALVVVGAARASGGSVSGLAMKIAGAVR